MRIAILFFLSLLVFTGCATEQGIEASDSNRTADWTYHPGEVAKQPVMDLSKTIRKGDHIVFLGDEMTQQMFYTRDFATAILSIMPRHELRIYNAGRSGATALSAQSWAGDVLKLTDATVVFVCLGLNDVYLKADEGVTAVEAYRNNLSKLVDVIREQKTVRQIILVGPPAVQLGLMTELPPSSYNAQLIHLGQQASEIAKEKKTGFIDLFIHTSAVYLGQMQVGGEPLTLGGKLPSEEGHVIIASVLLRGIGVTGEQLDQVAFSPLLPGRMGRIRPALAVKTSIPDEAGAVASRGIYWSLIRYDEAFFKQWRLAGRNRLSLSPQEAAAQVELTWGNVMQQVEELKNAIEPQPAAAK